ASRGGTRCKWHNSSLRSALRCRWPRASDVTSGMPMYGFKRWGSVVLISAWAVTAGSQTIPDRPGTQASDSTEVITTTKKSDADVWKLLPQPQQQTYEIGFLATGTDPENKLGWPFLKHLAADQKQFWTSLQQL